MKLLRSLRIFAVALLAVFSSPIAAAHDEKLHEDLSVSAFRSSDGLSAFLAQTLGLQFAPYDFITFLSTRSFDDPPNQANTPAGWLAFGSYQEDMQDPPVRGEHFLRSVNHFYNVVQGRTPGEALGLSDSTEKQWGLPKPINNSYAWATTLAGC